MAHNTQEIWKPVRRFPRYEVSSLGRVRSWGNHQGGLRSEPRLLTPTLGRSPKYYSISFYDRHTGRMKTESVHRVVLETFFGEAPRGYQAGHLDGNSHNNTLSNLAWVTPKENAKHRYAHARQPEGEASNFSKATEEKVRAIRQLKQAHPEWNVSALARIFGISRNCISDILLGKTWRRVSIEPPKRHKNGRLVKNTRAVGTPEEELA